jgi:TonB family protein
MKNITLLALLVTAISSFTVSAQDTTYLNANWKETTPDKSSYFRIKQKTDSGWLVKDYFRNGKPQMTGLFKDDSLTIADGHFTWYDEKGLNRRCTLAGGKKEGAEIYYYPNGHVKATGNNKTGEMDGEWLGYYTNGKPSGKATYTNGKQLSASFFQEDGTRDKSITQFMQEAQYPGGPSQLLKFINKNIKYPDAAVKNNTEGTVIVSVKITKDGIPADFKVTKSVDKNLDAEAINVLRQMPEWKPAILGGIPTDMYINQPITFQLKAKK